MPPKLFALFTCVSFLVCSICPPTWAKAPETAKIAFSSDRDGNLEIYLMNPDGSGVIRLTDHPTRDYEPVWSPTGEQIIFVSHRDGVRDLYLMNADGGNVEKVFKSTVDRSEPTWSPDGERFAYLRYNEATLYVASIRERQEIPVAKTGKFGGYPAWSPDGETIAFTFSPKAPEGPVLRGDLPGYPLILISPQGQKQKEILPNPQLRLTRPAWSPSGDQIAFAEDPWIAGEKGTIYVVNPDGSGMKVVTPKDADADRPAWSPRGDELIYEQDVNNEWQLFKITLSNRRTIQITNNGRNSYADWFDPAALPVTSQAQLLTTTWGKLKRK